MITIKLENSTQTQAFGALLSSYLAPYDILCLEGDLGAGKTTLSQGILNALGVQKEACSPTFTLIETYEALPIPVYHIDVYRLVDNPEEIFDLGLDEYLSRPTIVLIEWADLIKDKLPKEKIIINLKRTDDDKRVLSMEANFENEIFKEWTDENSSC